MTFFAQARFIGPVEGINIHYQEGVLNLDLHIAHSHGNHLFEVHLKGPLAEEALNEVQEGTVVTVKTAMVTDENGTYTFPVIRYVCIAKAKPPLHNTRESKFAGRKITRCPPMPALNVEEERQARENYQP